MFDHIPLTISDSLFTSISPNPVFIFCLVMCFDLNNEPIELPKILPRFDAFLRPIILKIQNNEIMLINSKKYLTIYI